MLKSVNFFLLTIIILFSSCQIKNTNKEKKSREISKIILKYEYDFIYKSALDSLIHWQSNQIEKYRYLDIGEWTLDSLLCVNKKGDKIITTVAYTTSKYKNSDHDGLIYFYGVKVGNDWFFFQGASIHLPREYYQDDVHKPLTFEKMHQIALKEIYGSYLKKNKKGEWEINDDYFERIPNKNGPAEGYGSCLKCITEDEYYMYLVRKNWQNRDTTMVKRDSIKM